MSRYEDTAAEGTAAAAGDMTDIAASSSVFSRGAAALAQNADSLVPRPHCLDDELTPSTADHQTVPEVDYNNEFLSHL
jgi:hypothetical protein